jgi:hypothetical protein
VLHGDIMRAVNDQDHRPDVSRERAAANRLRALLVAELVLFALASLLHRGILANGFQHARAAIAESIVALVLAIGLAISVYSPNEARPAALWTQGFALLGVCIGIAMILIGVGPHTGLDYGIHAAMAVTLITGLVVARRVSPPKPLI